MENDIKKVEKKKVEKKKSFIYETKQSSVIIDGVNYKNKDGKIKLPKAYNFPKSKLI